MPALEIRFDPGLVEEMVFLELKRLEEGGQQGIAREFHERRARLYELSEPGEGEGFFRRMARESFRSLGLEGLFTARMEEFPALAQRLEAVVVRRVWSRKEEEVELYRDPAGGQAGRKAAATLAARLLAGRCLDRSRFTAFLRHEWMHIDDMLDPGFAYSPERALGGESEMEDDLVRERFRLLWDLWVHGRMRRREWPTLASDETRRWQFDRAFRFLKPLERERIFGETLARSRFTQGELLEQARDQRLLKALGAGGVRCPLCRFPALEGVTDWKGAGAAVARTIRAGHPEWSPAQGACRQCFDLYSARLREAPAEGAMGRREFIRAAPGYLAGLLRQALGHEPSSQGARLP